MNPAPPTARELASQVRHLASLPDLYLQMRRLMADPETTVGEIAELVSCDPAITARLLRFANSAMLGLARRVDTVTKAVNVLGTQLVHDVVLANAMTQALSGVNTRHISMARFWANSVFCGLVAREIALRCNVLDSERLFIEGLLRDIGHLVMYQQIPAAASQALQRSADKGRPLHLVERELLGYDFAEVGAELMTAWNLPDAMAAVTRQHVEPISTGEHWLETNIIYVASQLTARYDAAEPLGARPLGDDLSRVWQSLGLPEDEIATVFINAERGVSEARELFVVAAAAA